MSPGRRITVGSVELWVETHGDGPHPVLLLSGSDSPALRWSDTLLTMLTGAGCRVVAFDHRDCGRSTEMSASVGYTLDDLTADAVGVLDATGIDRAHVVGHSMGAMVALRLALDHPTRLQSLALFGSSPGPDDRLAPPAPQLLASLEERLWEPVPREPDARVRWLVDRQRVFAGPRGIDEQRELAVARREVDEAWRPETGHGPAVAASTSVLDRLDAIDVPTLVVHGAADHLFPPAHAEATTRSIDGAHLVVVPDLGHELPDWLWPLVGPTLLTHLLGQGV